MNEVEKNLNDLALHKFQLASEFLTLNKEMENILDSYRLNLSKTRSVIGLSATSAAFIDNRDLEPVVRIRINSDGMFSLVPSDVADPNKINRACQFRPFGILEPLCAKAARHDIIKALPLICEIASIKYKLNELNKEYCKLKKSSALVT